METNEIAPRMEADYAEERSRLEANIVEAALDMRLKDPNGAYHFDGVEIDELWTEKFEAEYLAATEVFEATVDALLEFEDKHDWKGFDQPFTLAVKT